MGDAWEDEGPGRGGTVDDGEESLAPALEDGFSDPEELEEEDDDSWDDEPGDD